MKISNILSAMMFMGAVTAAHSDVCHHVPGSVTCGKGTVSSLNGNGMVTVSGTHVNGDTRVNGMLVADDAHFLAITVNGSASFIQCQIDDEVMVRGSVKASSTQFKKAVAIYSNSVRLVNSTIADTLTMRHTQSNSQTLYLDQDCKIEGDIIFEDGHGTVYVQKGTIIQGQVIGGNIIEK